MEEKRRGYTNGTSVFEAEANETVMLLQAGGAVKVVVKGPRFKSAGVVILADDVHMKGVSGLECGNFSTAKKVENWVVF